MAFHDNLDVMFSAEQIRARVAELGAAISRDHQGGDLVVVSILKGSYIFCADLVRAIDLPLSVDFLGLSSYGGKTETSGVVRITSDLSRPIDGKHVLVVEDIVDTGLTVHFLLENLWTRQPAGIKVCALLEKPSRAEKKIAIDYKGFEIPDAFVVGYGLDFDERSGYLFLHEAGPTGVLNIGRSAKGSVTPVFGGNMKRMVALVWSHMLLAWGSNLWIGMMIAITGCVSMGPTQVGSTLGEWPSLVSADRSSVGTGSDRPVGRLAMSAVPEKAGILGSITANTSADATTEIRVTSDWPHTELIRHLGTSYGTGVVGGHTAAVTTFHLEKVCRAPCTATLLTEGSYFADAPGMQAREFLLPPGSRSLDIRVRGVRHTPLVASLWGAMMGGATAIVGAGMWALFGSSEGELDSRRNAQGQLEYYRKPPNTTAFQTMTFVGTSVLLVGVAGLILFPRTHVETSDGVVLDTP